MPSVVCFGEALVDLLAEPSMQPGAPQRFVRYAGGAPANVAVAVARLGAPAVFVGMLAEDSFGDFLLQSLAAAGVSTQYIARTRAAHTALALVSLDAHGERQFSFYRPPAADLLFRSHHFHGACFAEAAVFHACSNSLTEAAIAEVTLEGMRRAQTAGALVSFDMNLRLNLWPESTDPRPRIWQALHAAELVKLSATELAFLAEPLGDEAAVFDNLWRGRTQWVWVTDADAPIRHFTRSGNGTLPAFAVRTVNATAAGDAFVGGVLSWLVKDNVRAASLTEWLADATRMRNALRFAAACGALAVARHGAFEAMPSLSEVERFLDAHS
ncbi:MAG: carbohydrate kinase [Gammaproteobacteria bacterium]|nr:carbohydrate kinase [Gammaproteobacteria bacterium]MDE2140474.1 carbohydrate kinase [Gammaproteobacteria bacterium]